MTKGMKITGVKTVKHEGRKVSVQFIEVGTDEVLFSLDKYLLDDDSAVDIINCQVENVNGIAKVTIPIIAEAAVQIEHNRG